jgi:MFS family permease
MTDTLVAEGAASADASRLSLSRSQANLVFATVALGMLLSALDQTVVATALPTIVSDLGGAGHLSWVVTSYMLAETVSTAVARKFGDLFGRKRVFQASVLIFIVGFAMLGSITFLPTFLQYVSRASATLSGVRTLPMVIGLLVTAVGSGMAVGRTGRYKAFPIAGGAVMAIGRGHKRPRHGLLEPRRNS